MECGPTLLPDRTARAAGEDPVPSLPVPPSQSTTTPRWRPADLLRATRNVSLHGGVWASAAGRGAHHRGITVKHPKGAPVEPDKRRTRRGGRGGIRLILCPETGQRIIELLLARVLIRFHAGAALFCFAASHRKAKNPNLCEPSASSACPVKCRQSRPCEAGFNRGASVVHHSCP